MSMNLVTLLYLIASVCFIQALKGLSHPTSSIRGNLFGMIGMAIAAVTTALLIIKLADGNLTGMAWVVLGLVAGGAYGAWRAKTVEMTKMPELVAFFHSMIGLAAVFIAVAAVAEPWAFQIVAKGEEIPSGNRLELFLGAAIGAITFSGSLSLPKAITEPLKVMAPMAAPRNSSKRLPPGIGSPLAAVIAKA